MQELVSIMPNPHIRKITVMQPGVEIQIAIVGNYADVELENIRLEAVINKECARREEVRLREICGKLEKEQNV